ncbi:MAG: hypothetical protein K0R61_2940 [Microvirga sp.]|jgi:hypothetical protein|nr:hypothetical protein [Microvirga sp.]MDF2758434.1 hypothetical protein [Thermomicrobiales bacterium]MDF2972490.1 hypothetical protein [Microvirga sp.]
MVPFQFRKYGASDQLRLGWASWDEDRSEVPMKYTWFDKLGRACRGGEVPIEAIPVMMAMAAQSGHLRGSRSVPMSLRRSRISLRR